MYCYLFCLHDGIEVFWAFDERLARNACFEDVFCIICLTIGRHQAFALYIRARLNLEESTLLVIAPLTCCLKNCAQLSGSYLFKRGNYEYCAGASLFAITEKRGRVLPVLPKVILARSHLEAVGNSRGPSNSDIPWMERGNNTVRQ